MDNENIELRLINIQLVDDNNRRYAGSLEIVTSFDLGMAFQVKVRSDIDIRGLYFKLRDVLISGKNHPLIKIKINDGIKGVEVDADYRLTYRLMVTDYYFSTQADCKFPLVNTMIYCKLSTLQTIDKCRSLSFESGEVIAGLDVSKTDSKLLGYTVCPMTKNIEHYLKRAKCYMGFNYGLVENIREYTYSCGKQRFQRYVAGESGDEASQDNYSPLCISLEQSTFVERYRKEPILIQNQYQLLNARTEESRLRLVELCESIILMLKVMYRTTNQVCALSKEMRNQVNGLMKAVRQTGSKWEFQIVNATNFQLIGLALLLYNSGLVTPDYIIRFQNIIGKGPEGLTIEQMMKIARLVIKARNDYVHFKGREAGDIHGVIEILSELNTALLYQFLDGDYLQSDELNSRVSFYYPKYLVDIAKIDDPLAPDNSYFKPNYQGYELKWIKSQLFRQRNYCNENLIRLQGQSDIRVWAHFEGLYRELFHRLGFVEKYTSDKQSPENSLYRTGERLYATTGSSGAGVDALIGDYDFKLNITSSKFKLFASEYKDSIGVQKLLIDIEGGINNLVNVSIYPKWGWFSKFKGERFDRYVYNISILYVLINKFRTKRNRITKRSLELILNGTDLGLGCKKLRQIVDYLLGFSDTYDYCLQIHQITKPCATMLIESGADDSDDFLTLDYLQMILSYWHTRYHFFEEEQKVDRIV